MSKTFLGWCVVFGAVVAGPELTAQQSASVLAQKTASVAPAETAARCARTGVRMKYEAYIAGVNAGEATLQLTRSDATYRVEGRARSKGLWESMQQWRAEYSVDGVLPLRAPIVPAAAATSAEPGGLRAKPRLPKPGHFFTLQTTPNKRREIHIEDGVLRETKNHKVRDPRPAQTGYDLLSALFFLPACHSAARVHTGRDGYLFSRVGASEVDREGANKATCNYEVVDEDGDKYSLGMTYRQVEGISVPAIIRVQGPLPGRMVLVESAPLERAASCS